MKKLNSFTKFLALVIATIFIFSMWGISVNAQSQITENTKLALRGIGPIKYGMTVDEASRVAGVRLVRSYADVDVVDPDFCSYFNPQGAPEGIAFMASKGRIVRTDITNERVTTIKGVQIGDTEERIFALYPGQIKATQHPYISRPPYNGKYLTFMPKDTEDQNYRIIFETSKNRVIRFRSGQLPQVEYIEGCL